MTWQIDELQIPADLDAEPAEAAALRTWMDATARAFLMGRHSDAAFEQWWRTMVADGQQVRQVTDAGDVVGTWADFAWRLDLGAGPTPFWAITDVTVRPTHRRRGILRDMMTDGLRRARSAGAPMAGLTVSEGSIYGRFGFGNAGSMWNVEITARDFELRQKPTGSVELVEPAALGAHYDELVQLTRRTWPGVHPMEPHRVMTVAEWDFDKEAAPTDRYAAVHRAPGGADDASAGTGAVDGGIVWRFERKPEGNVAQIVRLWGSAEAVLALLELCARIDLVEVVTLSSAPPLPQLRAALVDPRAVRVLGYRDGVWLRPLDLPACVAARPWGQDGMVTVHVVDPLGFVDGSWTLTVRDGVGRAETGSDVEADLVLDVEAFGSLLGEADLRDLAAAGRVTTHRDLAELARIVGINPAPWQNVFF